MVQWCQAGLVEADRSYGAYKTYCGSREEA